MPQNGGTIPRLFAVFALKTIRYDRCQWNVEPKHHTTMLRWVVTFLVIAIIAGIFGFGGLAAGAAGIAKVIFYIFLILLVLSLLFGSRIWKNVP